MSRSLVTRLSLAIVLAMLISLGLAEVVAAKQEQPMWLGGDTNESVPREPEGQPESAFVKEMQELFGDRGPATTTTPAPPSSNTRQMRIQGIPVVPDRVHVWTEKSAYVPGDDVRLFFRIPRAAYVYILNVDTANEIRLVFPNAMDPNAYIDKAGTHSLPRRNYAFPVVGPVGREHLLLIASSEPISYLDREARRSGDRPLSDDSGWVYRLFRDWIRDTKAWSAFAWNSFRVEARFGWPLPHNRPPVVRISASATRITAGTRVSFSSSGSYDPDGHIRAYRWDLDGDGRTDATGESAQWTYGASGTYVVRLTVEDNRGATTSETVQIVVEAKKTELKIESSPKGGAIYVDGSYVGSTSVKYYVTPGSHDVRVVGPGGQTFSTVVNVAPGTRSIKVEVSF